MARSPWGPCSTPGPARTCNSVLGSDVQFDNRADLALQIVLHQLDLYDELHDTVSRPLHKHP